MTIIQSDVKRQFFLKTDRAKLRTTLNLWHNDGFNGFYISTAGKNNGLLLCAHREAEGKLLAEYIFESLVARYQSGLFLEKVNDSLYFIVFDQGILHHAEEIPLSILQSAEKSPPALRTLILNINRLAQQSVESQHVIIANNVTVSDGDDCVVEGHVHLPFSVTSIVRVDNFIEHSDRLKLPALKHKRDLVIPHGRVKWLLLPLIMTVMGFVVMNLQGDEKIIERIETIDRYAQLKTVLMKTGINVKIKVVLLYEDLRRVEALQNWALVSLAGDIRSNVIKLKSINDMASVEVVKRFAQDYQYIFTQDNDGVILARNVSHTPVMKTAYRMNIAEQQRYLEGERKKYWKSNLTVDSAKAVSNGLWNEIKLILTFDQMTIHDLDAIGSIVNGRPFSFESIEILPVANGYLKGKMIINLIGVVDNG